MGDGGYRLDIPISQINPQQQYKVLLLVDYIENGEKHHFFEERIVNGDSLSNWSSFIIPEENLYTTTINTADEILPISNINYYFESGLEWAATSFADLIQMV